MHFLFINQSGRLRSGWRVAIFLFVYFLMASIFRVAEEMAFAAIQIGDYLSKMLFFIVNSFFLLTLALLLGWSAGKFFESVPFRAIGVTFTTNWLKHLSIGIAIGASTLSFAVLIAFLFGGEQFQLNISNSASAVVSSLLVSFIVFAVASAFEEALFRGYILQTFSRSGLAWLAIILTSVFFGSVHLGNPNASLISALNTILAGIWFSIAYLKTRDLWFVWGMHLMWNWMQGSLFGIEVSGLTEITPTPLLREIDTGPAWLTGTTYGLEGGVACTIAIIISMGLIYFMPGLKSDEEMQTLTSMPSGS